MSQRNGQSRTKSTTSSMRRDSIKDSKITIKNSNGTIINVTRNIIRRILSNHPKKYTVNFQDTLRPITIMHCHPSVFEDLYDSVKVQNSSHIKADTFIKECCGAISIEETTETREKGKYIVIVPEEKVDSARTAIGKMFQELQQSGGRPAAMACLSAYQNYPLVNDNVTVSGHAQRLSEKIRSRYLNRIQAIRVFAVRVTPIFANKKHALNN
jgi:hypothetical protein